MKPRTIPTSPKQKELESIENVYSADQPIIQPGPRYGSAIALSALLSILLWFMLFFGLRYAANRWPSINYLEFFRTSKTAPTERIIVNDTAPIEAKGTMGDILKQLTPSIMSLVKHNKNETAYQGQSVGQAIALTSDGVALTTQHISADVKQHSAYTVTGVRMEVDATLNDSYSGLTFIKVPSPTNAITFGSLNEIGVGSRVFIVNFSPTHGGVRGVESAVSAFRDNELTYVQGASGAVVESSEVNTRRFTLSGSLDATWIGSVVVDDQGRCIGLVTSTNERIRVVPVDSVRARTDVFSNESPFKRPRLGVAYIDLAYATAGSSFPSKGALVTALIDGKGASEKSPARTAGLRSNDVIIAVNTKPLSEFYSLSEAVAEQSVGEKITFSVLRDEVSQSIIVTLGEHSEQ